MCNCWIGVLNDYDQSDTNNLYLDDYISKLKERSERTKTMHSMSPGMFRYTTEPSDYLDRRKSMANLFNYCPECGIKINWKKLKKDLQATI